MEGMTGVGSPLVLQAVAATGLDICVIQNWIGNYKRSQKGSETRPSKPKFYTRDLSPYNLFCRDVLRKKGTMKDIKGRWSTLEEKQKDKYKQEAATLRAQGQDLSIEMRELKIKKNLNQLKLQVSKLEELGVETPILSFDRQKSGLEVYEVSSKGAADFLDSTDTANNFALHFKANSSCTTDSTTHSNKGQVNDLVKKVQDLFNQRYSFPAACRIRAVSRSDEGPSPGPDDNAVLKCQLVCPYGGSLYHSTDKALSGKFVSRSYP
ncbi:unnamed protein product [Leuciscus chuanchicus]